MATSDKPEQSTDDALTATAKTLGKAAGKVAAAVGVKPEGSGAQDAPVRRTSTKVPKLEKKNKNRLPRREKKARQKAASL